MVSIATSQILLVSTYVKRNLILSSTKKLAKSDVYYRKWSFEK